MKTLLLALVLVSGFATSALAAPVSCGQLIDAKIKISGELEYIKGRINDADNSDVVDFFMDQYEELYGRFQNVDSQIENNCK